MSTEERYPFALSSGAAGRTAVWVCVHVADSDNAARAWLVEQRLRPNWDPPLVGPPGRAASSTSGTVLLPPVLAR